MSYPSEGLEGAVDSIKTNIRHLIFKNSSLSHTNDSLFDTVSAKMKGQLNRLDFPSKEAIIEFRKKNEFERAYRKENPKDPQLTYRPAKNYYAVESEGVNYWMDVYFELFSGFCSCDNFFLLKKAIFSYWIFYLIHPFSDANKRTAAFIFEFQTKLSLSKLFGGFNEKESLDQHEEAHVGAKESNFYTKFLDLENLRCESTFFACYTLEKLKINLT